MTRRFGRACALLICYIALSVSGVSVYAQDMPDLRWSRSLNVIVLNALAGSQANQTPFDAMPLRTADLPEKISVLLSQSPEWMTLGLKEFDLHEQVSLIDIPLCQ